MNKQRIDVFISSTSFDLPEHRQKVIDVLNTLKLQPLGMEYWEVTGEDPVDLCKRQVFDSEIFIGIYGHRYGWCPKGYRGKSITEMEFDWAGEVEREGKPIPRLCFIMDEIHPLTEDMLEPEKQAKLEKFKKRVTAYQVGFFKSPDDLAKQVMAALIPFAQQMNNQAAVPYLRWLHEQSRKSDLLSLLNLRDITPDAQQMGVDDVYTPPDTRSIGIRYGAEPLASTEFIGKVKDDVAKVLRIIETEHQDFEAAQRSVMEAANSFSRLVLLGDPGSGKSTFLKFLALCLSGHYLNSENGWLDKLAEQGWEQGSRLPVVITLPDFAQNEGGALALMEYLQGYLTKWQFEEAFPVIRMALERGQAVVMLDGLDEVPVEKRDMVRAAVQTMIERFHPDNRYLITCRILSYTNPEWKLAGIHEETIAPFDDSKIKHFIRVWYRAKHALGEIDETTADKRITDLTAGLADPRLQSIAENPMLLTVMATVHNRTGTLPRETARLYQRCVELLLTEWKPLDARTLLETLEVDELVLYQMLWEIAYDAHDKQSDREGAANISQADMLVIAANHLQGDMGKAQAFCDYVERRAGLLIGRGLSGRWRMFAFPHRTFQEYLAGCYLASNEFAELAPDLARRGAGWREALMLAAGHLVFNQVQLNIALGGVDELTPAEEPPDTVDDWRNVWLAGDMLALIGAQAVTTSKKGARILPRVCDRLRNLLDGGHLPPVERAAAGRALAALGDPRPGVGLRPDGLPDIVWCDVPAGEFIFGQGKNQQRLPLPAYQIAKYPVTYRQFQAFIDAPDGFGNDEWWAGLAQREEAPYEQEFKYDNHPRETVTWYSAVAFCNWLTYKRNPAAWQWLQHWRAEHPGQSYPNLSPSPQSSVPSSQSFAFIRLPTEAEWEKAARGTDGRIYPYEGDFDVNKGNSYETGIRMTSAVGMFPEGASPCGALEMSGNVWEWCLSKYVEDYQWPEDNAVDGTNDRCLRGGSWNDFPDVARAVYRFDVPASDRYSSIGFRLVCVSPSE